MSKQVQWGRVLMEGALIVVSILLAFAIQAWWETSRERVEAQQLLANLYEELTGARVQVLNAVDFYRGTERAGTRLTEFALSDGSEVPTDLLMLLWNTLVEFNSTHFETDVLDGMLASGRLDIVSDERLRGRLAAWPRVVGEFTEQEVFLLEFSAQADPVLRELPDMAALWVDPPMLDPAGNWTGPDREPSGAALRFVQSNAGRTMIARGARLRRNARRDVEAALGTIDELLVLIGAEIQ